MLWISAFGSSEVPSGDVVKVGLVGCSSSSFAVSMETVYGSFSCNLGDVLVDFFSPSLGNVSEISIISFGAVVVSVEEGVSPMERPSKSNAALDLEACLGGIEKAGSPVEISRGGN
jgi:hypothetical protein